MAKTIFVSRCLFCDSEFETTDKRKKFCNSSCAAKYNNKNRKRNNLSKKLTSKSLKKYYKKNPHLLTPKKEFFWAGIKTSKHKFVKNPKSLYDFSSRTRVKILKRLGISCFIGEWNEEVCDLHHIKGRKIPNCHNHKNLTYLCPNHHRLVHNKRISIESIMTLEEKIGDEWKKYYYG